jgi:hypothetical protein
MLKSKAMASEFDAPNRGAHQQQRQVIVGAQRSEHGMPAPAALQAVLSGAAARRGVKVVSPAYAQARAYCSGRDFLRDLHAALPQRCHAAVCTDDTYAVLTKEGFPVLPLPAVKATLGTH